MDKRMIFMNGMLRKWQVHKSSRLFKQLGNIYKHVKSILKFSCKLYIMINFQAIVTPVLLA